MQFGWPIQRLGLSAAVFTRDTARGLRVARQIKSGIFRQGPTPDEANAVGASGPPARRSAARRVSKLHRTAWIRLTHLAISI